MNQLNFPKNKIIEGRPRLKQANLAQRSLPSHPTTLPARPTLLTAPTKAIDSAAPSGFDPLKHCRLCDAAIKFFGLDHSLCSGDCGWVVDLVWLAAHPPKPPKQQAWAATHPMKESETETLDLFTYGLDKDSSEDFGGAE